MTPETPSDPEPRTLRIRGAPVTFTDEGDGPPLVALHGLPGSARDFRWLASALAGRLRFIRIDMPGFGGTDRGAATGLDLSDRADFVLDVLHDLGLSRVVLLGHSMGGPVAVATANRAPETIASVALLASPGLRPHRMLKRFPARSLATLLGIGPTRAVLKHPMRWAFRSVGFSRSLPFEELVLTTEAAAATSIREHAANVKALRQPTLVAWAEDDHLVEQEIFAELGRACPEGPRLVYLHGGHNIQKSHAGELARNLVPWVREAFAVASVSGH